MPKTPPKREQKLSFAHRAREFWWFASELQRLIDDRCVSDSEIVRAAVKMERDADKLWLDLLNFADPDALKAMSAAQTRTIPAEGFPLKPDADEFGVITLNEHRQLAPLIREHMAALTDAAETFRQGLQKSAPETGLLFKAVKDLGNVRRLLAAQLLTDHTGDAPADEIEGIYAEARTSDQASL